MASLLDVEESEDLLERERLPADIAIRRKPRGSRLRQCAVSGAPVVWAVTLLLLIQAVLVGLKLDVLAMASVSWLWIYLPMTVACGLSLVFLGWRLVASVRGFKQHDSLDSIARVLFWAGTCLCWWAGFPLAVLGLGAASIAPACTWCIVCALGVVLFTFRSARSPLPKLAAVLGSAGLILLAAFVLIISLKLSGSLNNVSWSLTLMPLWLMPVIAVIGPILSCLSLTLLCDTPCSRVWDCGRNDNAEGVVLGAGGFIAFAMSFPPLLTGLLLMPRLEGYSDSRLYSLSLIPVYVQLLMINVVALHSCFKKLRAS